MLRESIHEKLWNAFYDLQESGLLTDSSKIYKALEELRKGYISFSSLFNGEEKKNLALQLESNLKKLEELVSGLDTQLPVLAREYLNDPLFGPLPFLKNIRGQEQEAEKKKREEEGKKRDKEEEEKERQRGRLKSFLAKGQIYRPEDFSFLYEKFVQFQQDMGEWFRDDQNAYLDFMSKSLGTNRFAIDILEATGYIIPPEHSQGFIKKFLDQLTHSESRKGEILARIEYFKWDILEVV